MLWTYKIYIYISVIGFRSFVPFFSHIIWLLHRLSRTQKYVQTNTRMHYECEYPISRRPPVCVERLGMLYIFCQMPIVFWFNCFNAHRTSIRCRLDFVHHTEHWNKYEHKIHVYFITDWKRTVQPFFVQIKMITGAWYTIEHDAIIGQ